MKVVKEAKLNEAKEKLPISFLTDFVSKGWEEVGYLKADIEAIKEAYSGTAKIEELIQGLVDAYLVCIGQMEAHLQDKKYLEFPEDSKLTEDKSLKEDINIAVNNEEILINDGEETVAVIPTPTAEECPEGKCDIPPVEANIEPVVEPIADEPVTEPEPLEKPFEFDVPKAENIRKFEKPEVADFFVDFDDPVGEPVTEKELYGDGEDEIPGEKIDDDIAEEE